MIIVWDEPKRLANLYKHGFDFAELTEGFFASSVIVPANRGRSMAVGRLSNGVIAVVFVFVGRVGVWVIYLRPPDSKDRRLLG